MFRNHRKYDRKFFNHKLWDFYSAFSIVPDVGSNTTFGDISTECKLLNGVSGSSLPIGVAPTGAQTFAHVNGELDNVRGKYAEHISEMYVRYP